MLELRPYQREAVDAVHEALSKRNVRKPAIGLPTGTGKTLVFSKLVEERGHPALILAHRDELIQQAADKYSQIDPSVPIGIVKGPLHQADLPVVVGSVQSLARQARLDRMPRDFRTIVVDECHHIVAPSYMRIARHFDDVEVLLGVSATLERGDRKALGKILEDIVYHRSILDMIQQGYLVDIRALSVAIKGFRLGDLRIVRGDYQDADIGRLLEETGANFIAARAYIDHAPGRKAIVFTPTIATAQIFAAAFNAEGIPATSVSGDLHIDDRRERLRAFSDGDFKVVCNAQVLTEGYDEPSVDCVINARPTRSRPAYVQLIGRGTRLYPGKDDLLVLDLAGSGKQLDIISIPKLFGLDPEKVRDEGVVEAQRLKMMEPEFRAKRQAGLEIELDAQELNLFDRKDINWLKLTNGNWILSGKRGTIFLERHGEKWSSVLRPREAGRAPIQLCEGMDLAMAMGVAEEKVVRKAKHDTLRLIDKTQRWRSEPATPGQLNALRRFRVVAADGLTKGQASDLLDAAIATADR